jgi:hypothetical protein
VVSKKDYDAIQVEAARSVMLELVRLLAEYRDDIVVVGGWVPALLIPQDRKPHIGSTDVDLALNHRTLTGPGYKTICRLLEGRGYTQDKKQPFIFWRTVKVGDKEIVVEVDLLAGEYEGTGKTHRTQTVQDVRAPECGQCPAQGAACHGAESSVPANRSKRDFISVVRGLAIIGWCTGTREDASQRAGRATEGNWNHWRVASNPAR